LLSWSGVSGRCGWSGAKRRLSWVAGLGIAELWAAGFSVGVVLAAVCVAAASPLEFAEDVSGGAGSGFATPVLVASLDPFGVCAAGG
jgi:predicted membrane metal-binding protein